ncbi:L-fuculose phosphate aldolase [Poriferisphaera corsica]|uniref:L-fuculose phosphate aldolase n=1 Tax=Poriferisphaera corsica TaxID=2528020 RepID=A0A517YUR2_9BACT|nr:class II aldolase/adducin family protein [Poriferisphaera corsica]QDU33902.1 L-fuculose phosphate aldolase [Poriferisphaera corsica]
MDKSVWQLKQDICEIGRRIWTRQYCAGNEGNHSVKISDNRFLVTPTGISKGFLEPGDICLTDDNGKLVEANQNDRRPSSEIKVHLAIYKKRPDVNAVIHSHPPHATAFAIAGVPLPESVHPEAEVFLGKVPTAKYALPSTKELPESILPLITENNSTVLMGNHGSVTFSHDLTDAYYRLEILDAYCRMLLLTKQIGKINILSQQEMKDLLQVKANFGFADDRVACADDGCIGAENDQFLTTFGIQPATAVCDQSSGNVLNTNTESPNVQLDPEQMETLVQTITDQIIKSLQNT